ncbi:MAG TPA: hypothetical protein VN956_00660 [Pyrinomonadaceae bacterium]|nr:hypothetical protein [Pyrinomonadaceae bacterium]
MKNIPSLANYSGIIFQQERLRRGVSGRVSAGLLLILFSAFSIQAQQKNVGYVLSLKGNWYLQNGTHPLERFGKLPAGATVTIRKLFDKSDYITLALFNGETIQRFCTVTNCGPSIILPKTPKQSPTGRSLRGAVVQGTAEGSSRSVGNKISETFWSLFEHPEHYFVSTLARSGVPNFQDTLVKQDSGTANLNSVFENVPPATYHLIATLLSLENPQELAPRSASTSFDVEWDQHQPNLASTDKLYPGLYSLVGDSHYQCWVLVANLDQFKAASDCFRRATESARLWVPGNDQLSARMFLRAYLVNLAKKLREPSSQKAGSVLCSQGSAE